jgi:hypothetical protein
VSLDLVSFSRVSSCQVSGRQNNALLKKRSFYKNLSFGKRRELAGESGYSIFLLFSTISSVVLL